MAVKEDQAAEMQSIEKMLSSWLGLTTAAKTAGVSERTMSYMVADGRMRSVQTPVGRLIEPTQLTAYAETHRTRRTRSRGNGLMTRREQIDAKRVREIEEQEARRAIEEQGDADMVASA